MSGESAFVIAGASLAGAKAAETLRAGGFGGPVILIGAEQERPYERPPLSKDYLLGKADRESIYVHPAGWYGEHDVTLRLGTTVSGIDRAGHQVLLADGSQVGYAKLLLATGSEPRRLTVPGAGQDGVLYLRQVGDSDQIRAASRPRRGWWSLAAAGSAWRLRPQPARPAPR
jgi:3-phenylpropionate/trans-cinnamate dioxygenase ferredoxin reductase component